jgi:hypothetical protein
VVFADYEVPVAQSMIKMAIQLQDADAHPMEGFLCYWAAFNNIYVTIAERAGRRPELRKNPDGSIRTRTVGGVDVPQVTVVGERDQIDLTFREFTDDLKCQLVEHPSSMFFVHLFPELMSGVGSYAGSPRRPAHPEDQRGAAGPKATVWRRCS